MAHAAVRDGSECALMVWLQHGAGCADKWNGWRQSCAWAATVDQSTIMVSYVRCAAQEFEKLC